MIKDFRRSLARYDFLISVLETITEGLELSLIDNKNWFAFGPRIARKFLNQAYSLRLSFFPRDIEYLAKQGIHNDDVSSMLTLLRMQFETHAIFYHFFIPCNDIEENILRFRLWELDGMRSRLTLSMKEPNSSEDDLINWTYLNIQRVEESIKSLRYFQSLPQKQQDELLKRSLWKFSSTSLLETDKSKWSNSYSKMILTAGLKEEFHKNLYTYLSMHTHPHYIGVIQNKISVEEIEIMRYVSITQSCFVTAFLIEDLSKRFVEPKRYISNLAEEQLLIFRSIITAGRNN